MEDKSDRKGCLYTALALFGLAAFKPLLGLILGASTEEIYASESIDRTTGEVTNDIEYLRMAFAILVIAVIVYFYPDIKKLLNNK